MAMIDASPKAEQLAALAQLFADAETLLKTYLDSAAGQNDQNFMALSTAAIKLNNAADAIADMQLDLAAEADAQAVTTINRTTAQLQSAIDTRKVIADDLALVQSIVAFSAAIAAGDPGSMVSCGEDLCGKLTG